MVALETKKLEHILTFLIIVTGLLLINILASSTFFRLDLTEEKRFSISQATKDVLNELDESLYIEIYLEGDLPSGFERMKRIIQQTLDEFRIHTEDRLQYRFVNPDQALSAEARQEFTRNLMNKGIQPIDVFNTVKGQRIQKRIYPGVLISYGISEEGVNLFRGNESAPPEVRLNQSIENVEYQLASAIRKLTTTRLKSIGFVKGHGELDSLDIISFKTSLSENYLVKDLYLGDSNEITGTDMIMIAKPTRAYSELDKYKIDQFIIRGGKALFLLDRLAVNMDSAGVGTFSFTLKSNLEDILFRYGVRINPDLVQDIVSGTTPVVVGAIGEQPQISLLPWLYYPLINNFSEHIITRNLNVVKTEFVSSIDTVKADGIVKIPLFFSSQYTRTVQAPVQIRIEDMRQAPDPSVMSKQNLPLGYLLEGRFTSLYKNRFPPQGIDRGKHMDQSASSAVIVVPDGDIVKNQVNQNGPLPLGFDQFSNQTYGNADLLMNMVDYLLEKDGLITARAKEIKIRPLNQVKIGIERLQWQVINLVGPVVLLVIFGLIKSYLRKKKYTGFVTED